jgi:hypothetical protein
MLAMISSELFRPKQGVDQVHKQAQRCDTGNDVVHEILLNTIRVGQVGNLRRIGNPPGADFGIIYGPITNRPQVINLLPHTIS